MRYKIVQNEIRETTSIDAPYDTRADAMAAWKELNSVDLDAYAPLTADQKYSLYLTQFSPNGCNDLIVVDKSTNEIVDIIEEATFGYPSNTAIKFDASLCHMDGLTLDSVESLQDEELVEAGMIEGLYTVSINDVLRRIAVNPMDDGSDTVKKIKKLGLI